MSDTWELQEAAEAAYRARPEPPPYTESERLEDFAADARHAEWREEDRSWQRDENDLH